MPLLKWCERHGVHFDGQYTDDMLRQVERAATGQQELSPPQIQFPRMPERVDSEHMQEA
jgi:hypothetical protein